MTTHPLFKLAETDCEIAAYFQLRQEIFCHEQRLFEDDRDSVDAIAYPIVAIAASADTPRVIGIVRIYEQEPRLWYGGRLGVHPDFRRGGRIGRGLIQQAVATANGWGCDRFLATVQAQNVRFFRRLHWCSLEEIDICQRPHHLMEADLTYYPPNGEPQPQRSAQRVA